MPPKLVLISVVDDDMSVRRALRRLLHLSGYAVETFASGSEFLDSPALGLTSCLVLDIHLQDMTGFELQGRLAGTWAAIPLIFITAHDDAATRERMRQAGVGSYLRKPFEKRALLAAIERALAPDDGAPDQQARG
jgi:FixJ family two-component response regulator